MSKDLDKIEEVFPGAKGNDLIVALVEALEEAKDKRVMAQSEAGQTLSKELWQKCLDLLSILRSGYKDASHHSLIAMIAAVDIQMGLYEELVNAEFIENMAKTELDNAVKELGE